MCPFQGQGKKSQTHNISKLAVKDKRYFVFYFLLIKPLIVKFGTNYKFCFTVGLHTEQTCRMLQV